MRDDLCANGLPRTLYELTKLPDDMLRTKLASGAVKPFACECFSAACRPPCGRFSRVLEFRCCPSRTDSAKSVGGRHAADCGLARKARHVRVCKVLCRKSH